MRILFITTKHPEKQGDLLEVSLLHGLRTVLGEDFVDYPRKKIMYHDFSDSPKDSLHGRGFSLLTTPIEDLSDRDIENQKFDCILYGDGHMYNEPPNSEEFSHLADGNVWIIDGHDLYGGAPVQMMHDGERVQGNQFSNCFKRELIDTSDDSIFPTGFGIPEERIREVDFSIKNQLFPKTAPSMAIFGSNPETGGGFAHHKFTVEEEYYDDISKSWFGPTCKKGGWDCLRHYEIIAAGTLLLFKDYDRKPPLCSPQELPCFSYSNPNELKNLIGRLVVNNQPTNEYLDMLQKQREWLLNFGTTSARAKYIISILQQKITK